MEVLESTFLLIRFSVPTILLEWTNLLGIKSLNVKFSKYQKQSSGGVLQKGVLKIFAEFIENIKIFRYAVFFYASVNLFFLSSPLDYLIFIVIRSCILLF